MYPLPVADRSLVVNIILIGMVDDPPDIIIIIPMDPDNSVAEN